jgi:hypothetical protein
MGVDFICSDPWAPTSTVYSLLRTWTGIGTGTGTSISTLSFRWDSIDACTAGWLAPVVPTTMTYHFMFHTPYSILHIPYSIFHTPYPVGHKLDCKSFLCPNGLLGPGAACSTWHEQKGLFSGTPLVPWLGWAGLGN